MKHRKKRAAHGRLPCAYVHDDDGPGANPRRRENRNLFDSSKPDRKTLQLCGQVRRTLTAALAGQCRDPLLQGVVVESVVPAPDAGRLLVCVYPASAGVELDSIDPAEILARLGRVQGILRREVTEAIVRKHTPELAFRVIRPVEPGEVTP